MPYQVALGEAEVELLTGSAPGYEVARYVRDLSRPLLVMGSLGRQKRRGVLIGSTAESIFRSTTCDMLTFKG